MFRITAALLGTLLLLSATASAQDRGTEAEQQACTPDVFRLCGDYIPDEGSILACLKSKRASLSAACEPVIFPPSAAVAPSADDAPPRKVRHRKKHRKAPHA